MSKREFSVVDVNKVSTLLLSIGFTLSFNDVYLCRMCRVELKEIKGKDVTQHSDGCAIATAKRLLKECEE